MAIHLQAVLFLKRAIPQADVFTPLVGAVPDSQEDRIRDGVRVQTGGVGEGQQLQVTMSPARVDIVLLPIVSPGVMTEGVSNLGDFERSASSFAELMLSWLPKCDFPVLRLAMVARALAQAHTADGAYEILQDNLTSVRVQPGKMRDFFFRVNWPVSTASVSEGYLNRLSSWAALKFATRLEIPGGPQSEAVERHYAQREIDVSTPVEHAEELSRDVLAPIFGEISQVVIDTGRAGERS